MTGPVGRFLFGLTSHAWDNVLDGQNTGGKILIKLSVLLVLPNTCTNSLSFTAEVTTVFSKFEVWWISLYILLGFYPPETLRGSICWLEGVHVGTMDCTKL